MKKLAIAAALAHVTGLTGCEAYRREKRSGRRSTAAVVVEVEEVRKATMRDVGLFTGTLHPRSRFIVAPKIPGRLRRLLVDVGDRVVCDQLVAELEDDEYVQKLNQARAELRVAEANVEGTRSALEFAWREFKRIEALSKDEFTSKSELDAGEAQHKAQQARHQIALAQVAQKEAALQAAQVRLSYTRIRASWGEGTEASERVVGERFVDEGAMLAASSRIVSVLDIRSVDAVIHVIERDYSKVRVGQKVVVTTDAFPGRAFPGECVRVAPLLKEASRKARVEIEVPNEKELLKPGMFVLARIEFARREDVTVISTESLARRGGRGGVFLVDTKEMKASFRPVRLGIIDGELAEVLEPPLSGLVVTLGHHLLEDGSAVKLPTETTPQPRGPHAPPGTGRSGGGGRP